MIDMDIDELDKCSICMDTYDEKVHTRCLPCGHTFCSSCITNFISNGRLSCPNCRKSHNAYSANDFPINHDLESFISMIRKSKTETLPRDEPNVTRLSRSENKWQAVFSDERESLKNLIQISHDMKSDILEYKGFLDKRKRQHNESLSKFNDLALRSEAIIRDIDFEDKTVTDILKEGDRHEKKASETLRKFEKVTSTKDIVEASEEVTKCYEALDDWRSRSQLQLPNAKTIRLSDKLMKISTAVFRELKIEEADAEKNCEDPTELPLPIMDKLKMMRGKPPIAIAQLRTKSENIKNALADGLVFAVQNKDGRIRSARVTLEGDTTYLHVLKDEEPPIDAYTIQQSDLIKSLRADSVVSFMTLSWEGSIRGRVRFVLSPYAPIAQHFRVLSTGDLGPSYVHSRFLEVGNKGSSAVEYVCGGDYEFDDGSGGAALMTGLNPQDEIYRRRLTAGVLWTRYNYIDGPKSAQFGIITGSGCDDICRKIFGHVLDGLEILKEAAKLDDVKKVRIEDCGVILPF